LTGFFAAAEQAGQACVIGGIMADTALDQMQTGMMIEKRPL
jgi:hypothetical protein